MDMQTLDEGISKGIEMMAMQLALMCECYGVPVLIAYQSDDVTICSVRHIPQHVDNRLQVADLAVRSDKVEILITSLARHMHLVSTRH